MIKIPSIVYVITRESLKDTKAIMKMVMTPKHIVAREELMIRPLEIGLTKLKIMKDSCKTALGKPRNLY